MRVNQSYQNTSLSQYTTSLLFCPGKKTCTNLGNTMSASHDVLYYDFNSPIASIDSVRNHLQALASKELDQNNLFLIMDDSQINKIYSREIEGVELNYDASTKQAVPGLKMLTTLITDGNINMPINAVPYVSEKLAQSFYKTKSEIGIDIIKYLLPLFDFKRFLADAHYATITMLTFLFEQQINYLMKIPRNRIVTIGDKTGQLKQLLRLNRNNRTKYAKAIIHGIPCYVYVVKIDRYKTVYLISNDLIDVSRVHDMYRMRWQIEIFHRTAKQYLGMGDCQMRAIEKQLQHVLHVMLAYAIASVKRAYGNFNTVEDTIKHFRIVKSL